MALTQVSYPDNEKLFVGASNDLQIYHNGTNSYVQDAGTGSLYLMSDSHVYLIDSDGDTMVEAVKGGKVELRYDNTARLETTSTGVSMTGDVSIDSGRLLIGTSTEGHSSADNLTVADAGAAGITIRSGTSNDGSLFFSDGTSSADEYRGWVQYSHSSNFLTFATDGNERMRIDSSGRVTIGNTGNRTVWGGNTQFQIEGLDGATASQTIVRNSNDASYPWLGFGKSRGTSDGASTIVADDDCLGVIGWNGADGTNMDNNAAAIYCEVDGTPGNDNIPGRLEFHTATGGTSSERVRITSGGLVGVGITDPAAVLSVVGGTSNTPRVAIESSAGDHFTISQYQDGVGMYTLLGQNVQLNSSGNETVIDSGHKTAGIIFDGRGSGALSFNTGDTNATAQRMRITNTGMCQHTGDQDSNYLLTVHNDGNNTTRYGVNIQCGTDDASGTNYAVGFADGDGTTVGYITFTGGTITYGDFTAHHPCIIPDADNPSDSSNAYPYGTLLETISIEYTQKNGDNTERGIRYKVQKTQSANSKKVLGAYGSSMNGGPDDNTNEHQVLVLGDGHILCNNAGGNIEVGDGICSSSTAGIGQKATVNPSMIIGIAQEAVTFTGSENKLVAVQYGLQQFIPWT